MNNKNVFSRWKLKGCIKTRYVSFVRNHRNAINKHDSNDLVQNFKDK